MAIGDEKSLKFWRRVVSIMGALLIAAILFTVIAVTQGLHKKKGKDIATSKMYKAQNSSCEGGNINISNESGLRGAKIEGDRMLLRFDNKVVIVDYCSGKIISEVSVSLTKKSGL